MCLQRFEYIADMLACQLHQAAAHKVCGKNIDPKPLCRVLILNRLHDKFADFFKYWGGFGHIAAE